MTVWVSLTASIPSQFWSIPSSRISSASGCTPGSLSSQSGPYGSGKNPSESSSETVSPNSCPGVDVSETSPNSWPWVGTTVITPSLVSTNRVASFGSTAT